MLVDPVRTGIYVLAAIRQRHARDLVWREEFMAKLAGGKALQRAIDAGLPATATLLLRWRTDAARFQRETMRDRLYR